ncbi:MAG: SpaA isopeptide-forming pilin-related protein, partial [Raoultibacter sp.]
GSASVGPTVHTAHDQSQFFGTTLDAQLPGSFDSFWCLDLFTHATSEGHSGTYEATVTSVDVAAETVSYYVVLTPHDYADGYQRVGGTVTVHQDFGGTVTLHKTSSNPAITAGNPCYDMTGAVYGIYDLSWAEVGRLTCNADGWAQSGKLSRGSTYQVKEITPGKGYELDKEFYVVTINADNVDLHVTEKPQNDPIGTLLAKYDGDKTYDAANLPQGSASLALSHWQLNYYSDYHSTTDTTWTQSATPVRSWVMQTDEDGWVSLLAGEGTFTTKDGVIHPYKVSGDDFYRADGAGRITLPLGTVTLQEIKAPQGYLLPDPNPIYASQITSDGVLELVDTYNMPITPEPVKRGDIAIMKFGEQTPDPEGQPSIKVPLENVAFDIINLSEQSVLRPDNTQAATGEVVVSIKTDAQGHASTEALAVAGKSGALAFGTYRVHEDAATTPAGFDPVDDFVVTVAEDGKVLRYIAEDKITMTPVKVIKKDAETNKQIPAFVTYKLLDADKNPITMTTHYPQETIYETFTAAKDGTLTFPEKLTVGTYYLQETQAPEGYTKNPALISFSVTESHNWIDPIEVEFPDTPIKGKVEIIKTDKLDTTPVVGAVYAITATADITTPDGTVRAKKDQVMGSVTTDKDGKASLDGLYLGTYAATETQVPDGYALDTTPHPFVLTSEGQDVPVVITSLAL